MKVGNCTKLFTTNPQNDESVQINSENNSIDLSGSLKNVRPKKPRVNRRAASEKVQKSAPKRKKSSEKERERNEEIKANLQHLARKLPYVKKDLSRIRTLRLAKEYIKHLIRIVHGETVICPYTGQERLLSLSDFERVVHRELQTNNSYKDRAEMEITTSSESCSRLSFSAFSPPMDGTSPTSSIQPSSYDTQVKESPTILENPRSNDVSHSQEIQVNQKWENYSFESSSSFLPQAAILMEKNNRNSTNHILQNSTFLENTIQNDYYCYY